MTSNEKNLADRFRSGDAAAFDELYKLMHERIYRFALRLTGHTQDAEDVTVQTFIEAYRSREAFRGDARVETWLYRIAVYVANRAKRTKRHEPMPAQELEDTNASEQVGVVELQHMLLALPEDLRTAFLLVKVEGLTHKEAAEILGKRQGTVQTHVFRASKLLRRQLLSEPQQAVYDLPKGCML